MKNKPKRGKSLDDALRDGRYKKEYKIPDPLAGLVAVGFLEEKQRRERENYKPGPWTKYNSTEEGEVIEAAIRGDVRFLRDLATSIEILHKYGYEMGDDKKIRIPKKDSFKKYIAENFAEWGRENLRKFKLEVFYAEVGTKYEVHPAKVKQFVLEGKRNGWFIDKVEKPLSSGVKEVRRLFGDIVKRQSLSKNTAVAREVIKLRRDTDSPRSSYFVNLVQRVKDGMHPKSKQSR